MTRHKKKKKKLPAFNRRTLTDYIISDFRNNPTKLFNYKQIAKKLFIKDQRTRTLITEVLDSLCESKKIKEVYKGKYKFAPYSSTVTGTVQLTKGGSAYIISDESEEDIFVTRHNLNRALNGDKVKVSSKQGELQTTLQLSDQVAEGELFMPWHYSESPVNRLTRSDLDPFSKIAAFKLTACKVEKV